MSLVNRRILLIIGGGIAAYKTLDLIRRLRERGASVRAVLTRSAAEFVTPLSVSSLTGDKVYQDLFSLTDEAEIGHIELSRAADLLVVAPATANLMARMANGIADDLATTALLATDKPVLIAPAMNVRMWEHKATMRNVSRLMEDGVFVVGPNEGTMACNEFGYGRMAEPLEIIAAIEEIFQQGGDALSTRPLITSKSAEAYRPAAPDPVVTGPGPLTGRRILVTSGPTHEPIDPVRYLANRSSGKQGHAIASALARLGAHVTLISGPVNLPDPSGVEVHHVETAIEMLAACEKALPVDAAICAAAVADWRVVSHADEKMKKQAGGEPPRLQLVENPDILATLSRHGTARPRLVVGFAAETQNVMEFAIAKRVRKGCDWIVANDVSPRTGIMGGDANTVHLISSGNIESWPEMAKQDVAEKLAARIADEINAQKMTADDIDWED